MALIADTGALYALYDASDRRHRDVRRAVQLERGPIIIPAAIVAELDYLLRAFLGIEAELDWLDGLLSGAYALEPLARTDLLRCRELIARYRNLDLGLADAAVVATAERLDIHRILTLDERHFRAVRPKGGRSFLLLPADADE